MFLFRRNFPALAGALEKTANTAQAGLDKFLLDIVDKSFKTCLGGHLRDARAHGAGAEDADLFCFVSHSLAFRVRVSGSDSERDSETRNSILFSGKYRRAFFQERPHAFVVVGASAGDLLQMGFVIEIGFEIR